MKCLFFVWSLFFAKNVLATELVIDGKATYEVSVAVSDDEQRQGLMFVSELPENRGMFFDFRRFHNEKVAMWMKNTFIPLDMVFISCDFLIVDIYENAKPLSLDLIKSNENFCYVLEINGGETLRKGLEIGDKVLYPVQK